MTISVTGTVVLRTGSGAVRQDHPKTEHLRWYRRTGATVIARGASADAAATFLGHGSSAITEGHYAEPDRTVDRGPAGILERTLRRVNPDTSLLSTDDEAVDNPALDFLDEEDIEAAQCPFDRLISIVRAPTRDRSAIRAVIA